MRFAIRLRLLLSLENTTFDSTTRKVKLKKKHLREAVKLRQDAYGDRAQYFFANTINVKKKEKGTKEFYLDLSYQKYIYIYIWT